TKLSDRVLDLETTKTAQAKEIASLKKRIKKLERKRKLKTPGMNLFKIGTSRRRSLGEEDASKQGRNLKQGKHSLIFEESDFDDEGFDVDIDEVFKDVKGDAEQVISAAADEVSIGDAVNTAGTEVNIASASVTTAGVSVSTTKPITTASVNITIAEPITPPTTTTTVFKDEDLIIAQTLIKMRSEKSKLAVRLQAQEQEELTIKERSKLFIELMDKRKKHFARLEAEEQRRKPLTKAQKRNQMCTYLKNMTGFTHNQLKNKSFDEVQKAFNKTMSWIDLFVPVDSEVVKGSKDRAEGSETRAEESSKRAGEDLQQEYTKK
ncbi:hypothetical protein Tco_0170073, partial [Tanacetum coccineum]